MPNAQPAGSDSICEQSRPFRPEDRGTKRPLQNRNAVALVEAARLFGRAALLPQHCKIQIDALPNDVINEFCGSQLNPRHQKYEEKTGFSPCVRFHHCELSG
jgi:hypothetical protein